MAIELNRKLSDFSEFRVTLQSRPPAIMHGAAIVVVALAVAAIGWAWWVEADVVVAAAGRVRPVEAPVCVFTQPGTLLDGRVAEVFVQEGDRVAAEQIMFRLDTSRLDHEIERLERRLAGLVEQLSKAETLDGLTIEQRRAAEAKARAELAQAEAELATAGERRESRMRQSRSELTVATDQHQRLRGLRASRVVAEEELVRAAGAREQAEEELRQASLPVDSGRVDVLRKTLDNVVSDFAARRAELDTRRAATLAERDEVATQLSSLRLERGRAVVRSPIAGVVVGGAARAGDVLPLGRPAFEVAREEGFRFEATLPSEDVGQIRVGMPVKLRFDAYDHRSYGTLDGEVCFVSPDSSPAVAESVSSIDAYGARPASAGEAAKSGRVHYVLRVTLNGSEVRRNELRGPVKLGLGGVAEVVVERASILEIIVKKMRGTISLL